MVGPVSRWWLKLSISSGLVSAVRPASRSVLVAALVACSTADLTPASAPPTSSGGPAAAPTEDQDPGTVPPIDGGSEPEAGSTPLAMSSGVTIQVLPSDSGDALLAAIRGAKKSVHMTMYLLTNDDVVTALGDLKKAGKDVKVVLNKTFPPNGGDNQPKYTALKNKGVQVTWAPSGYTFTHAKTIVIDGEKALIMTMNLTESSATTNREYIATDTDPADVAELEKIFAADLSNQAVRLPSKLVISPADANTLHSARQQIKALIDSAKTSLDVEAQSLSDDTIVDAIVSAHQSKVDVHVVVDGDTVSTPSQKDAVAKLKEHGVPVRSLKSPDMHAKAIVVDEARTFIGSQNMTPTALDQNREIGVLTDAKSEATKVRKVITSDFAKGAAL
ncbi:MAG TPA: phospholipase D-like domain-containing protein [Labilithrix sp.]|nr:phospholipase D-like domain-containing protein [Labilithrix sp.]